MIDWNKRLIDACNSVLEMPAACTTDDEVRSSVVRREYLKHCVAQAKLFSHESIEEPFICKMTMSAEEACEFSRKNVGRVCFVQGIDWEKVTDYDDTVRCSVTFAPAKFMQNENTKETE